MSEPDCDYHINHLKHQGRSYPLEAFFLDNIFAFHQSLSGYLPTPLIKLGLKPAGLETNTVYVKDESKRFSTGAFKSLGASWAIHSFLRKNKGEYTFCSATDGNHGRAVAWSARISGHKAKIFMPASTVHARIKFIENEGAEVIIVGGDYDKAVEMAKKDAEVNGHILIQDTSWEGYDDYPQLISAGYSSQLKELETQMNSGQRNKVNAIILQSGVGSWAAATMLYSVRKSLFPNAKFIILEPFESDCLLESAIHGKICSTRKSQNTIMAGLNCGTPSLTAWEIISDLADAFVSVDDSWARKAVRSLYEAGFETCESGAAGLAGLMAILNSKKLNPFCKELGLNKNSTFLVFNTEGITDPAMLSEIISSDWK
ncbi:MAG: diaminopropionate ammonia-lyase [Bacteroidales bacterium]|nr:diaminopropionate ammonia-lyase [Bacteroidales bacterium]